MALKFVQNINLNGLELQNVVLQPLTTAPTTLNSVGRMYFNTTDKKPFWYNGSEFITFPLQSDITAMQSDITTLQDYFTDGKANDSLKLGGVALGSLFTDLSSNTTNAVSVTVGGVTKNITTATLKTSLGLKSLAYKDSLVASDIPAISWDKITANTRPTTIAGYGITDSIIYDGDIDISDVSADNIKYRHIGYGYPASGWKYAGPALSIGAFTGYALLIQQKTTSNTLYVSRVYAGAKNGSWDALISDANKDEFLTDYLKVDGTAASAEKLKTKRSIWGQDFDGTGNVSGNLSSVGSISFMNDKIYIANSGAITIRSADVGGWARGISFTDSTSSKTLLGTFGARGMDPETLMYLYMGAAYDSENTIRIYSNGNVSIGYNSNIAPTEKLFVNGSLRIGDATLYYEDGVLMSDKPFASLGAVSTKGAGDSSGSGGSVDLTAVTSNILPASGSLTSGVSSYSIGSASAMWKDVYTKNLYVGDVNIVSTISSLQTTVGQHASNIQGLITSVANIQSTYATIRYVDDQINSVKSDIALILDNTSTEAIDSIKEIVNIIGDAGAALVKRYNGTITGNGTMTTFDVTHNLGTTDVIVMVYEVSTMQQVFVDITVTSSTLVKLAFAVAPASGVKYKVVVLA